MCECVCECVCLHARFSNDIFFYDNICLVCGVCVGGRVGERVVVEPVNEAFFITSMNCEGRMIGLSAINSPIRVR